MESPTNRPNQSPASDRVRVLRDSLKEHNLDCLLVSSRENVRYLLGFTGSSGWAVISENDTVLMTDSRYVEQAEAQLQSGKVCLATGGLVDSIAHHVGEKGFKSIGFEPDILSFASVRSIESSLRQSARGCQAIAAEGLVESLRVVKDDMEVALIQDAAVLADGVFSHVCSIVRPGMSERELAWRIERWLRENGSGAVPFSIIVASGPNAALPHAEPGERTFGEGEPILMDLGATVGGYCSDMTRTLFLGEPCGDFADVYHTVLEAQQRAIAGIRADMRAADADELARSVIRAAGFESAFGHGLGHGVGLQIHERPTVSPRSGDALVNGMVFSVEPGIYLPERGGVRIEDTVVLRDGVAVPLTLSDKADPVVQLP